jgi:subtilisin family serine protease
VNWLRTMLAALALALGAPASAHAQDTEASELLAAPSGDTTQRQLLVMLRLPPRHYRPDAGYGGNYMHDTGVAARRRVATAIAQAHGLRLRDSWPMPAIGIDCFIMEDTGTAPLARALDALALDARVAWAQALAEYHALADADPLYPVQPAAQAWRLADLHRASTGRNVTVAVIDSGVDALHPDLAGQAGMRRNFVDDAPGPAEKHGTAVASIIQARTGNGQGIAGVAPRAHVLALRACWETGAQAARCNTLTLGKALNFAIENNARIINMSLAGPPDRLLQALLDAAVSRGVIVVGAADPQIADGGFPASHPGVFGVARTGDAHPASAPLLYAPGTDVPSCMPGARWGMVSGSSYAAAHVTGLLALLAELQPRASAQALRRLLAARPPLPLNATAIPAAAPATGTIDACAALARAANSCVCLCSPTANLAASLH